MLYYVNSIDTPNAHFYRDNILQVCYLYLQLSYLYFSLLANYLCQAWLCKLHINVSGDIELNPGPKSNSYENFSVCH